MNQIEKANYKILGLVDQFDEQGIITGQYPIGSVQSLPVDQGTQAVAEGRAEAVGSEGESNNVSLGVGIPPKQHVDNTPVKKYKIIGEIFPLNEDGSQQEVALEIDSVQEVPESVGKGWVEGGLAEEVE